MKISDGGVEKPVVAGAMLVHIAFLRTHAAVIHLIHGLGKEQAQSEAWKAGESESSL